MLRAHSWEEAVRRWREAAPGQVQPWAGGRGRAARASECQAKGDNVQAGVITLELLSWGI